MDEIKQAIRDRAFKPFRDGEEVPGVEEYRILECGERLELGLSVKTNAGRRYFTIKITENY